LKVLIVGAGVIGTVYGAHVAAAGNQVSVLSHGQRTGEVAAEGMCARDVLGGGRVSAGATVVPDASGDYDVVLVAVRRDQLASAGADLAVLAGEPAVVFFGNNPAGRAAIPGDLPGDAYLGFPGVGGVMAGGTADSEDERPAGPRAQQCRRPGPQERHGAHRPDQAHREGRRVGDLEFTFELVLFGGGHAAPRLAAGWLTGSTTVPRVPRTRSAASSSWPIIAGLPVPSTKRQAASTFGPIDPAGNFKARRAAGVVRPMGRAASVPKPVSTLATSVRITRASAPRSRASSAVLRSLSMTASAP